MLRAELRRFSVKRPRWGSRRAHHHLRELGWSVNRKRVQRLWREEGLRVPQRKRKRRRLGESTVPAERLRAERPNHVWAFDFQFDQTADEQALKLLNIVDEFTREALVMLVARDVDADTVVETLERLVAARGAPELLRCDNGPGDNRTCTQGLVRTVEGRTMLSQPSSPWQNPFVESFRFRVRDELLDVEEFSCLAEARVVIGDWREDYNRHRPHSSLGCAPRPCSPPSGPPKATQRWQPDRPQGVCRAARAAAIAARHSLRSRLRDDGRGNLERRVPLSVRPGRYLLAPHIHHPLTRGGPTNGVRSVVLQ